MDVSVIITTKNEAENITKCLLSIKKQKYKGKAEIIVVDNNSSDLTCKISKKYTKLIFNKGPERSAQRNFGAGKAKGKYLIFLDADMCLSETLLKSALQKLENENLHALYIREKIVGKGYRQRVRSFERSFYTGTVIDAVRIVRKDIFEKVGGFDEELTGPEDWDFDHRVRKLGKTAVLYRSEYIVHRENISVVRYFAKKRYYAKSFVKYKKKWAGVPDVKKQFSPYYRLLGVFLENGKWKRFIVKPHLVFGLNFLRTGVGIGYIAELLKKAKDK